MPELAEKTPLFDLLVYVNNSEKPVIALSAVLWDEVDTADSDFAWSWPGKYGARATTQVGNRRFVLNNVVYTETRRSTKEVAVLNDDGIQVKPYWKRVELFLEDENE